MRLLGLLLALLAPLDGFDAYVQQAVADWEAPGLAIAVVKDGEVVFVRGYGVRELGRAEPVDEHTLFAIGSTTKAMTAALVGMLVDEGELGWDDPVQDHLPWFRVRDPWVSRELTVRDLLTHRAGLPNADFLWYGQDNPPREVLERMRFVSQETSMRSAFTYQNVMYAAAGELVAEVAGEPWPVVLRQRLLEPLGMDDTLATAEHLADRPNAASPHDRVDGRITVIGNASVDAVAPAGSVWSSVADMAEWMRFLLEGKTRDGAELLKKETLEELFEPQTLVDPDEFYPTRQLTGSHWTTYGLGWFQEDYAGRAVDFHTGSIDGMVAIHGLIRDERLGVYVLSNLDHAELRHALMYRVFDAFGAGATRDWSHELRELYAGRAAEAEKRRKEAEAERVAGTRPSLELARWAGTWTDPLYGSVEVTAGAEPRLVYGPGLQGDLEHWHYDTYRVRWDAAWRGTSLVRFELDERGRPSALVLEGARFAGHESPPAGR